MTLSEGDACDVPGAKVLFGTDLFEIRGGQGCFGDVCISGSVRINEFAATQSGSTWTVVSAAGASPPSDGTVGTTGTATAEASHGAEMSATVVRGRIVARLLADGRIEFGFQPEGSERILPRLRMFPTDARVGAWLRSSLIEIAPQ